jgi:Sel1 repeat
MGLFDIFRRKQETSEPFESRGRSKTHWMILGPSDHQVTAAVVVETQPAAPHRALQLTEPRLDQRALSSVEFSQAPPPPYGDAVSTTAFEMLRREAEGGYAPAQHLLALQYLNGVGIRPSLMLAEQWLTKAASAGDTAAQFTLGMLHWDGYLLGKNIYQARYWLKKAAEGGHPRAKGVLAQLPREPARLVSQDGSGSAKQVNRDQPRASKSQHRSRSKYPETFAEKPEIIGKTRASKPSDFAIVGEKTTIHNESFFWAGFKAGKQCFESAKRGGYTNLVWAARRIAQKWGLQQLIVTEECRSYLMDQILSLMRVALRL